MKDIRHKISRAAVAIAAGMAASLSFGGEAQAAFTGPGVYVIQVGRTGQVLDIDNTWGRGGAEGQHVLRWGRNGGDNQKFIISPDGDGYTIQALNSLQCLDLPGWAHEVGVEIVQYRCTGDGNQRFYIDATNGGAFIRAAHGNNILFAETEGGRVKLAAPPPVGRETLGMLFLFERR